MDALKNVRHHITGLYRVTRRDSVADQKKALESADCARMYEWSDIEDLITQLRTGDMVVVPKALCLGPTRKDIRETLSRIRSKKASVFVLDTGQHSENLDDAIQIVFDAVGQLTGDSKALTPEEAAKNGRKKGAKRRAERLLVTEARIIWKEHPEWSNTECLKHMPGWSEQMAYRHPQLGPRGLAKGRPQGLKKIKNDGPPQMFVYFLQNGRKKMVKIGTTSDVKKRTGQLRHPLLPGQRVLATMDGGYGLERELHKRFAKYRIKGEWFKFEGALLKFVQALPTYKSN